VFYDRDVVVVDKPVGMLSVALTPRSAWFTASTRIRAG
jgi:23S rRNA-/tRNA-specific pseudouridylate synthase